MEYDNILSSYKAFLLTFGRQVGIFCSIDWSEPMTRRRMRLERLSITPGRRPVEKNTRVQSVVLFVSSFECDVHLPQVLTELRSMLSLHWL
jgi:hypothetical protein